MTQTMEPSDQGSQIGTPNLATYCAELFNGPYDQCRKVGRNYAFRVGRGMDQAFVDECQAEAIFQLVELIWTTYPALIAEYPEEAARHKMYRGFVSYRLRDYFSYRATSTVSYLKKKGISVVHFSHDDLLTFQEGQPVEHPALARLSIDVEVYILLDSVCHDDVERQVVDLYALGNSKEEIGSIMNISPNRAKKILRRIKRRIRHSEDF